MAHSKSRPLRWPDYLLIKTLAIIETVALRAIPRGVIRKFVLGHVDRLLQQVHISQCGKI
jgi:hypothetical protein